jgi:hypothetical protein
MILMISIFWIWYTKMVQYAICSVTSHMWPHTSWTLRLVAKQYQVSKFHMNIYHVITWQHIRMSQWRNWNRTLKSKNIQGHSFVFWTSVDQQSKVLMKLYNTSHSQVQNFSTSFLHIFLLKACCRNATKVITFYLWRFFICMKIGCCLERVVSFMCPLPI